MIKEKAVWCFARDLCKNEKDKLKVGLEMLKLGMSTQIVQFNGTYYKHVGNDEQDPGLTIGGYESACLSDLLVAFVFEKLNPKLFSNNFILSKMHRDDGLLVTKKNWNINEFKTWIETFQEEVNKLLQSEKLQFALDVWMHNELESTNNEITLNEKVTTNKTNAFPFLDVKMTWNDSIITHEAHFKENQRIKHLSKESTHKETVFHATPRGVFNRLSLLTTFNDSNTNKRVDELHPTHAKALVQAGIMKKNEFPILSECVKEPSKLKAPLIDSVEKFNYDYDRTSHFTIGCCNAWKHNFTPRLIKRLKNKHQMTWIRTRMACRRFENIEELMISHANNMVMKNWMSRDFKQRDCNCNVANEDAKGKCMFNGQCRMTCVIYELQCKISKKKHIGQTQQNLKERTNQHFNDVVKLNNRGIHSDSFANHCAKFFKKNDVVRAKDVRNMIEIKILRELDPTNVSKKFGTNECQLCMQERMCIAKAKLFKPSTHVNKNMETFGACRHKAKMHRCEPIQCANANEIK